MSLPETEIVTRKCDFDWVINQSLSGQSLTIHHIVAFHLFLLSLRPLWHPRSGVNRRLLLHGLHQHSSFYSNVSDPRPLRQPLANARFSWRFCLSLVWQQNADSIPNRIYHVDRRWVRAFARAFLYSEGHITQNSRKQLCVMNKNARVLVDESLIQYIFPSWRYLSPNFHEISFNLDFATFIHYHSVRWFFVLLFFLSHYHLSVFSLAYFCSIFCYTDSLCPTALWPFSFCLLIYSVPLSFSPTVSTVCFS